MSIKEVAGGKPTEKIGSLTLKEKQALKGILNKSLCPVTNLVGNEDKETKDKPEVINLESQLTKMRSNWLSETTFFLNLAKPLLQKTIESKIKGFPEKENLRMGLDTFSNYFSYFNEEKKDSGNPPNKEARGFLKFGEKLLHKNLKKFEGVIDEKDNFPDMKDVNSILRAVRNLAYVTHDEKVRSDSVDFMIRNFEKTVNLKNLFFCFANKEDVDDFFNSSDYIKTVVELGNPEQMKKSQKSLYSLISETENRSALPYFVLLKYWAELHNDEYIKDFFLENYNLEINKSLTDPYDSTAIIEIGSSTRPSLILKDICAISSLEDKRPGITNELTKSFGILHFSKYPERILIHQYDETIKENKTGTFEKLPLYGEIINISMDYYANFEDEKELYGKLYDRLLEKNGNLKIFEIKHAGKLISIFNQSAKNYGKIDFATIGGEGSPDGLGMAFNQGKRIRGALLEEDFKKESVKKITAEAFKKNAVIILNSCMQGIPNGMAQTISKQGLKVISSPELIDAIIKLDPLFNDDGIDFDVEFTDGEKTIKPSIYKNGELYRKE